MRLKKLISMVGPSDYAAIIQGQTGVGKELVAESCARRRAVEKVNL